MGRCGDHRWHVCVMGDCGVTWQRDWESGSYVELSQHIMKLQGVKTEEVRGYDKSRLGRDC
jgi:hypothetical protein